MSFLSDFRTMVLGILLESFPFILLGVVISALLQTFISDQLLQRWIPKEPFLASFWMLAGHCLPALRMRNYPCCSSTDPQRHAALYRTCLHDGWTDY